MTSDFHETMKLVEEALTKLEQGHDNPESVRAFIEEMLDLLPSDELSFKQKLRMKEAQLRLEKVLKRDQPEH